jgi:hypothetical protein
MDGKCVTLFEFQEFCHHWRTKDNLVKAAAATNAATNKEREVRGTNTHWEPSGDA